MRMHFVRMVLYACFASTVAQAQQSVRIIDLPAPDATSSTQFSSILNIHEFPNGRVAINDPTSRRLVLLDSKLAFERVLLDSALTQGSYGRNSVSLLNCNCSELWFPDLASRSILTFDQNGDQKRVISTPGSSDFVLILNARAIADTVNHLFYRARAPRTPLPGRPVTGPQQNPDSTALLRASFETRTVDTLALLRSLRTWTQYGTPDGGARIAVDILASIDEWTALADGSVAVVRGRDYHIDWYLPDGTKVSSPKLAFDFKPLTNDDKSRMMDSTRKAELEKHRASYDRYRANPASGGGAEPVAAAGSDGRIRVRSALGAPTTVGEYRAPTIDDVPFDRMPDYYPPIRLGAVSGDLAGNVWILPTTSAQSRAGELVYDVVNRQKGLVARVRIPAGRSIGGFGRDGQVYLISRDANGQWTVERSKLPPLT